MTLDQELNDNWFLETRENLKYNALNGNINSYCESNLTYKKAIRYASIELIEKLTIGVSKQCL